MAAPRHLRSRHATLVKLPDATEVKDVNDGEQRQSRVYIPPPLIFSGLVSFLMEADIFGSRNEWARIKRNNLYGQ